MGARGPVPKRSTQRRRQNKPADGVEVQAAAGAEEVPVPEPDPEWHPTARRWFESLAPSGQSRFYEPSDWATAYVVAESMSRELSPQPMAVGVGKEARIEMVLMPPKGAALSSWLKAMSNLLVTEGDRRRIRLELHRPKGEGEEAADVSDLDEHRRRARSG